MNDFVLFMPISVLFLFVGLLVYTINAGFTMGLILSVLGILVSLASITLLTSGHIWLQKLTNQSNKRV